MSLILILVPDALPAIPLQNALEASGQTVRLVAGDDAVDIALQVNRVKPDVLALHQDLSDALGACARLLASPITRYLPIIALSNTRPDAKTVSRFLSAGAHDIVELDGVTELQVARIDNMARVNHLRRTYRRLNDAVSVHRAEFTALFDAVPIGVVMATAAGTVNNMNASARALLGGHSIYDLRLAEGGRMQQHPLAAAARGERVGARRFIVRGGQDHPDRTVVIEAFPLTVAGDLPIGAVAIVANAGEGAERARALRESARGLARQTEDMERFVATASHDMKNPLNTIQRYVELALDRGDAPASEVEGWMTRIDVNASRLRHLVEGLLTVVRSRRATLTLAPVELSDVVADAVRVQKAAIEESGARIQVDDPLPGAWVDFDLFEQVVENLLSNAIKYRSPEGSCRIRIGTADLEPGQAYIYVQDNGIGIDPCHHAEVFEPFERLHRKDVIPGSGLGLAIARQLIERHGGRIWVTSTLGHGATFHVVLPSGG